PGQHDGLEGGPRPAADPRRADAADDARRVGAARRRDARREVDPLRGRAGHSARHRPWDLPVRHLLERVGWRRLHRSWHPAAGNYIALVEQVAAVRTAIVSTGSERGDTIVRDDVLRIADFGLRV